MLVANSSDIININDRGVRLPDVRQQPIAALMNQPAGLPQMVLYAAESLPHRFLEIALALSRKL